MIDQELGNFPRRGNFNKAYLITDSGVFVDILNITGSGKLIFIMITNEADTNLTLRLTIDGYIFSQLVYNIVGTSVYVIPNSLVSVNVSLITDTKSYIFNSEFTTSLQLEIKKTAGIENVRGQILYNLD